MGMPNSYRTCGRKPRLVGIIRENSYEGIADTDGQRIVEILQTIRYLGDAAEATTVRVVRSSTVATAALSHPQAPGEQVQGIKVRAA
ncbi:hypothetical protein TNCV_1613571 [Trichonephila clavipes]|nr:hypothetical protein TNCV_1613571 [Trichonephila clavipes]